MDQIKYQGYARDRGFNPIQLSMGSVDAMAQQGNAMLRQMRDNQAQERQNRGEFLQGMQNAQQLEKQNRAENFEFDQRSRDRFQDAVNQNYRQQVVDAANAQQNLDKQVTALSVLAPLSQTVGKLVVDWKKKKDEADKINGYNYEYINGPDPVEQQRVQAGLAQLRKSDEVIQATADQLQASGASPEAVRAVRKTSKMFEVGRIMARTEMAARRWPGFLEQQKLENDQLQIPFVDPTTGIQTVITPKSAVGPEQKQAVHQALFQQFIKDNGFLDINPSLVSDSLKSMRVAEQRILDDERVAYNIASAEQMLEDVKSSVVPEFRSDPGGAFTRLMMAYSRSLDQQGKPLGFKTGREKAWDFLRQGIDANDITRETLDQIRNSPTPHQPNKTWGELYGWEISKLEEELDNNYIEDSRREDAVLQQDGKRWTDQVLEQISANPQSDQTLKDLVKASIDKFGFVDDRLQHYVNNYSQEKIDGERLNSEFEKLAQSNRLTVEMVTDPRVPWNVRKTWESEAITQSKARAQTGDYKSKYESIENAIVTASKWNSALGTPKHYTTPLAIAAAKAQFNSIVSALLKSGKATPQQAADQALQQVITDIGDGTSGKYKYSVEDERGFVNFGFNGYGTSRQASLDGAKHMAAIRQKFDSGAGLASLDHYALIPKNVLKQVDAQRNNPNLKPPAVAQYISELFGGRVSAHEVLNRQLGAQGFKPLPIPEPMRQVDQVIPPELRQLLLYKPSPTRAYRAYTGSGQFNASLVPNGYGKLIESVAAANGIHPGLLAGLVKVESGFNPNAVSSAGAYGLGQLMPDTARGLGVNPRDPRQNLQGAARYLRQMIDSFGGDINQGLRAYNQGPGNQQRFPGGVSSEARAYPGKVLQAAAAFGYNPNGGSPWRNTATMRPSVVYYIDSLGYGSTGPHLDVKRVDRGTLRSTGSVPISANELDKYVDVGNGRSWRPLSRGTKITDDEGRHRRRGSYGIDYAADAGTQVRLKNGAQVVGSFKGDQGTDHLVIELPDGRRFQFLHGTKA